MRDDLKLYKYHKNYSIYKSEQEWLNCYSDGAIESLQMVPGEFDTKTYKFSPSQITIQYRTGEIYQWETLYINSYNMGQFGIAVTADGKMFLLKLGKTVYFVLMPKPVNEFGEQKAAAELPTYLWAITPLQRNCTITLCN